METLWKQCGPEGVPAYMIEKGRASRTLISIFGIFCWIMFFQIFFREEGKGEVGGDSLERQEELAEFEWGPGSFSSSKS